MQPRVPMPEARCIMALFTHLRVREILGSAHPGSCILGRLERRRGRDMEPPESPDHSPCYTAGWLCRDPDAGAYRYTTGRAKKVSLHAGRTEREQNRDHIRQIYRAKYTVGVDNGPRAMPLSTVPAVHRECTESIPMRFLCSGM